MAPSVDKRQSTKMLPNEEKPMEICADEAEDVAADATATTTAAVFPRDYACTTKRYVRELCKKAQQHSQFAFCTTTTNTMNTDEQQCNRHSYAADCRCPAVTQQLVSSESNNQQQRDTWYTDLMLGGCGIAINGGVDAIRQREQQQTSSLQLSERLLCAGASADAHDDAATTTTTGKTTALLHVAVQHGDALAAEILMRHGADPAVKTRDGLDALALAVRAGSRDVAELLVNRGYSPVNQIVHDYDMKRQYGLLHLAIEWNHVEMAEFLLCRGIDVNQRDSYGNTCLHFASRLGRVEIVHLLLSHGARLHDKSFNDLTALYYAVENGHRDIFELLLNHGANLNDRGLGGATLLHYAIKNGDFELIDTLLHRGARVDATNRFGKTPLHFAIAQKNWRALELLLEHGANVNSKDALGKTSLHTAIECCRKEIYEMLLRRGADVNAKDNLQQTPLHFAVKQGCCATVELLLRHNADANARDDARQTPLHLAVRFGHVKLLEPMLRHRVDVNALDANGQSPLHLAVLSEHSKLIYCGYPYTFFAQLLRNGGRVRTRSHNSGETPLHAAVRKKCAIFVKHLLRGGAEVNAVESVGGKTSLRLALENDDVECAEQLLAHGADFAGVVFGQETISRDMMQLFARHFIKRHAAGMSDADPKFVAADEEFARLAEDEVKRMKLTKIRDDQTYYDFLRGNRRYLANIVAGSEVVGLLFEDHARTNFCGADESALKRTFPLYAEALERNYHVGARYAPLLNDAFDRLASVYKLPAVPTERILDFLDDDDMRNIVDAVPSLM